MSSPTVLRSNVVLTLLLGAVSAALQQNNPAFTIQSTQWLGYVTPSNSRALYDNGYCGMINNKNVCANGDSFICGTPSANLTTCGNLNGNPFFGSNSASVDTANPLQVLTVKDNSGNPIQFCPKLNTPDEQSNSLYAIGTTNPIGTGNGHGIIFVMPNDRSYQQPNKVLGSALAFVDATGAQPTCTRGAHLQWSSVNEPVWGDHGVLDGRGNYVYAYGQTYYNANDQWIYVMRALKPATTLGAWNYWNGTGWTPNRLINPPTSAAVMQRVNSGGFMWNPYLKQFLAVSSFGLEILMMTAPRPEGPWSRLVNVFADPTGQSNPHQWDYAAAFHPQFDASGKTVIVTWTTGIAIEAAKITFA